MNIARLKRLFRRSAPDTKATPSFDRTPESPEPFGYKVCWFAISTSDPASVIDALGFGKATPANWSSGLAAACGHEGDDRWVFVSPPLGGWVLAISGAWPYPTVETHHEIGKKFDILFARLAKRFDDVQFFGSYRVSDFAAWARAINGKPVRVFAYGDGQVLMNIGDQTAEEAKLGLVNLSGLSPTDAEDEIFRIAEERNDEEERLVAGGLSHADAIVKARQGGRDAFPGEEDVVDLAGLWSIHPTTLAEQDHPPGVGLAVRLPSDLRQ